MSLYKALNKVGYFDYKKEPEQKSKAIIITFPVAFLLDLAETLIQRGFYQHPYNKINQPVTQWYNLKHYQATKDLPRQIKNTKKEKILLGFKECIWQIKQVQADTEKGHWWHSMGNKPVNSSDIQYVYVNILGKIRYRFTCAGFNKGGEKTFPDNRKRSAKHWLLLTNPEPIKPEIKMGGFQGFRYYKENY